MTGEPVKLFGGLHADPLDITPKVQRMTSFRAGDAVDSRTKLTYLPYKLHQASTPLGQFVELSLQVP